MGDAVDDTHVEIWKVKKLIKSLQAGKYKKAFGDLRNRYFLSCGIGIWIYSIRVTYLVI